MTTTIKLRGDTAADWTAEDPILSAREPGLETDTGLWKWGDGVTAWTALPYVAGGGGGGGGGVPVTRLTYTAGDIRRSATSWGNYTTTAGGSLGTALDLTLPAVVGDVIEVGFGGVWNSAATDGFIDFWTVVGGAVVNPVAGNRGIPGAYGAPSIFSNAYGAAFRTLVSGDLSGGTVTVRPQGQNAAAVAKDILGSGGNAFLLSLKNLG